MTSPLRARLLAATAFLIVVAFALESAAQPKYVVYFKKGTLARFAKRLPEADAEFCKAKLTGLDQAREALGLASCKNKNPKLAPVVDVDVVWLIDDSARLAGMGRRISQFAIERNGERVLAGPHRIQVPMFLEKSLKMYSVLLVGESQAKGLTRAQWERMLLFAAKSPTTYSRLRLPRAFPDRVPREYTLSYGPQMSRWKADVRKASKPTGDQPPGGILKKRLLDLQQDREVYHETYLAEGQEILIGVAKQDRGALRKLNADNVVLDLLTEWQENKAAIRKAAAGAAATSKEIEASIARVDAEAAALEAFLKGAEKAALEARAKKLRTQIAKQERHFKKALAIGKTLAKGANPALLAKHLVTGFLSGKLDEAVIGGMRILFSRVERAEYRRIVRKIAKLEALIQTLKETEQRKRLTEAKKRLEAKLEEIVAYRVEGAFREWKTGDILKRLSAREAQKGGGPGRFAAAEKFHQNVDGMASTVLKATASYREVLETEPFSRSRLLYPLANRDWLEFRRRANWGRLTTKWRDYLFGYEFYWRQGELGNAPNRPQGKNVTYLLGRGYLRLVDSALGDAYCALDQPGIQCKWLYGWETGAKH